MPCRHAPRPCRLCGWSVQATWPPALGRSSRFGRRRRDWYSRGHHVGNYAITVQGDAALDAQTHRRSDTENFGWKIRWDADAAGMSCFLLNLAKPTPLDGK